MQGDVLSPAHQQARVRIEELLGQAIDGVEKVRRSGPSVEPRTVSEVSTIAAQVVGFVEACTLLAPDLVVPEQGRLEMLGAAVAGMGESFTGATLAPVMLRVDPPAPPAITAVPSAFGADRRKTPREDSVPRRVTVRRVLPDRRLAERRTLADRRALP